MLLFYLIYVTLLVTPGSAFFRHLCKGHLGVARIDPLVSPGKASLHAHIAFGASNFGFESTADDLLVSDCTSCSIKQDKSAYWTPQLYFHHSNGTFEIVPTVGGLTAYYFTERPDVGDKVFAFPHGFRMIAGDSSKRAFYGPNPDPPMSFWKASDITQQALMEKSIAFNCLHYAAGKNEPSLGVHHMRSKDFIDQSCVDGVRAELQFPSCWNGKDLDSHNHTTHVAYPSRLREGPCPTDYPVRLPTLFYETIYATFLFKDTHGEFVFANGDPTGFGYHGDFIAAWDDGVLQTVIDNKNCTTIDPAYHQSSGLQEDCPLFDLQSDSDAVSCKLTTPAILMKEKVDVIAALPGDVKIERGPQAMSSMIIQPSPSLALNTTLSSSATMTVPPALKTTSTTAVIGNRTVTHLVMVDEVVTKTVYVNNCTPKTPRHVHMRHHAH